MLKSNFCLIILIVTALVGVPIRTDATAAPAVPDATPSPAAAVSPTAVDNDGAKITADANATSAVTDVTSSPDAAGTTTSTATAYNDTECKKLIDACMANVMAVVEVESSMSIDEYRKSLCKEIPKAVTCLDPLRENKKHNVCGNYTGLNSSMMAQLKGMCPNTADTPVTSAVHDTTSSPDVSSTASTHNNYNGTYNDTECRQLIDDCMANFMALKDLYFFLSSDDYKYVLCPAVSKAGTCLDHLREYKEQNVCGNFSGLDSSKLLGHFKAICHDGGASTDSSTGTGDRGNRECSLQEAKCRQGQELELNVPMSERDEHWCHKLQATIICYDHTTCEKSDAQHKENENFLKDAYKGSCDGAGMIQVTLATLILSLLVAIKNNFM